MHHELHHLPRPGLRLVTTLLLMAVLALLALSLRAGEQIVYDATDAKIVARFADGYTVDGQPGTATPPRYVLDVIRHDVPAHDPETQRVTRLDPVIDLDTGTITYGYSVVALTAEEIAAQSVTVTPIEIVMSRLTDAEFAALTDPAAPVAVQRFVKLAEYRGMIRSDSPDLAAGVAALDQLGIIALSRWPTLLAPEE